MPQLTETYCNDITLSPRAWVARCGLHAVPMQKLGAICESARDEQQLRMIFGSAL